MNFDYQELIRAGVPQGYATAAIDYAAYRRRGIDTTQIGQGAFTDPTVFAKTYGGFLGNPTADQTASARTWLDFIRGAGDAIGSNYQSVTGPSGTVPLGGPTTPIPSIHGGFMPFAATGQGAVAALPAPPHPDGSNQALGVNVGGEDGVFRSTDLKGPTTNAQGGTNFAPLLLIGGGLILLFTLTRK